MKAWALSAICLVTAAAGAAAVAAIPSQVEKGNPDAQYAHRLLVENELFYPLRLNLYN